MRADRNVYSDPRGVRAAVGAVVAAESGYRRDIVKDWSIAGPYWRDQAVYDAQRLDDTAAGSEPAGIPAVQYTHGRFATAPRMVVVVAGPYIEWMQAPSWLPVDCQQCTANNSLLNVKKEEERRCPPIQNY